MSFPYNHYFLIFYPYIWVKFTTKQNDKLGKSF